MARGIYLSQAGGTVDGLTLTGNTATRGGGIYVAGGQPTLTDLTIQSNIAITGAGIYLDDSAALLQQNTLSGNGNGTTLDGGGIFIDDGHGDRADQHRQRELCGPRRRAGPARQHGHAPGQHHQRQPGDEQ